MHYWIGINLENAAFDPHPREELARILRALADRIELAPDIGRVGDTLPLRDVNGNTVGAAETREGECL